MYFKRRYKICICSVILGQLESFGNYKGFGIIFPKILDAIESFTKVASHRIFESERLGFLLLRENSLIWGVKSRNF